MVTVADLAAASAGGAAVLGLVLTGLAALAWRRTRTSRSLFLGAAFVVSAVQAALTAGLLSQRADLPRLWLAVPVAHAVALLLMYIALLRV